MLQSGHRNPKWPPKYLSFNLDGLESPLIPLFFGLSRDAKPFLKFVLQSGHQNTIWPPNIYKTTLIAMLASIGLMIVEKTPEKQCEVNIKGQRLTQVKQYLGTTIENSGQCKTEVEKIINQAKIVFWKRLPF